MLEHFHCKQTVQMALKLVMALIYMCLFDASRAKPVLKFRVDGKFKVVIFADLHFGEAPDELWGPEQDVNSSRVMSQILDSEKPDLVVYLGDLVTANNVPVQNATKYWKQALAPSLKRGIPWATVFGNHDDTAFEWPAGWFGPSGIPGLSQGHMSYFRGTTRKELLESEASETMSASSEGPEELWPSLSNYHLNISGNKKPGSAGAILYFLDSGGGSYPSVVSTHQAAWLQNLADEINPEKKTPELLFWHIPSKAYELVAPKPNSAIPSQCVGSINLEGVGSQTAEWGTMDVLMKRKSVKAMFSGHNHGLDWCCPSGSLWLCFSRHTGYGGYGNWTRGARVIELSEDNSHVKTWIRLEDGSVQSSLQID